jgi:deoxyinosine 3'endonuclease (endonuclease V)
VSLEAAVALVLDCAPNYRLPETTRWAHRVAGGASVPQLDPPTGFDAP